MKRKYRGGGGGGCLPKAGQSMDPFITEQLIKMIQSKNVSVHKKHFYNMIFSNFALSMSILRQPPHSI